MSAQAGDAPHIGAKPFFARARFFPPMWVRGLGAAAMALVMTTTMLGGLGGLGALDGVSAQTTGPVELVEVENGVVVTTGRYEIALDWPDPDALVPTDRPFAANVTLADGRTIEVGHHVSWVASSGPGQRTTEPIVEEQEGVHRVTVEDVTFALNETDGSWEVHVRYAYYGGPLVYQTRATNTFVFRADRVEHTYGFHHPAFLVPVVRNNVTMAFSEPYDLHVSVDPNGGVSADDGEALDPYATWESYKPYGILYKDSDSPLAFDYHRVYSSYWTNYLVEGRMRATHGDVYQVTYSVDGEGTTTSGRSGVEATDFWHFPDADVTPRELAAWYQQLTGISGGGGEPGPPNDASPWPLRCPSLPLNADGSECERVVVAVIDTGINPYHQWFRRPGWTAHPSTYIDGYPASATSLSLTFGGNQGDNRLDDLNAWAQVERGRFYTVPGTNIVGAISFGENYPGGGPILDDGGHGTGTAGAVTEVSPDALIVVVETGTGPGQFDAALDWVNAQEWIDVVSMSWGTLGNVGFLGRPADVTQAHPEMRTKAFWDQGKLTFVAAGNDGTATFLDQFDGPPWVVAVGGADSEPANTSYTLTARPFDVVADHNNTLPSHKDVYALTDWVGTSFSSPQAAGAVAEAILRARIATGHTGGITDGALVVGAGAGPLADGRLTNDEVRDAMNATARYLDAEGLFVPDPVRTPVLPVAPWLQQGWGHVGPATVEGLTSVLTGTATAPAKPAEVEAQQGAYQAVRELVWLHGYPVWGPVFQPLPNPTR